MKKWIFTFGLFIAIALGTFLTHQKADAAVLEIGLADVAVDSVNAVVDTTLDAAVSGDDKSPLANVDSIIEAKVLSEGDAVAADGSNSSAVVADADAVIDVQALTEGRLIDANICADIGLLGANGNACADESEAATPVRDKSEGASNGDVDTWNLAPIIVDADVELSEGEAAEPLTAVVNLCATPLIEAHAAVSDENASECGAAATPTEADSTPSTSEANAKVALTVDINAGGAGNAPVAMDNDNGGTSTPSVDTGNNTSNGNGNGGTTAPSIDLGVDTGTGNNGGGIVAVSTGGGKGTSGQAGQSSGDESDGSEASVTGLAANTSGSGSLTDGVDMLPKTGGWLDAQLLYGAAALLIVLGLVVRFFGARAYASRK